MASIEAFRRIQIEASETGVAETTQKVQGLDAAYGGLSKTVGTTASVTDVSAKRALSAADAYNRQTLALDPLAKAHDTLTKQVNIATSAFNQGVMGDVNSAAAKEALAVRVGALNQKYIEMNPALQQSNNGFLTMLGLEGMLEKAFIRMIALMAVREIFDFGKQLFENAAALKDQAEMAGVSTDAFQAYTAVMVQNGVSADQAATLIERLTRNIGTAKEQAGPARNALNELGVSYIDLANGTESALPKIAQGLIGIQDATERARLETVLFGRAGQALEASLQLLIDPTATLIEKQTALGQVMGHDVIDAAHDADVQLTQAWNSIKVGVTPAVVGITEGIMGIGTAIKYMVTEFLAIPQSLITLATMGLGHAAGLGSPANDTAPAPGLNNFGSTSTAAAAPGKDFPTTDFDKYLADAKIAADLAGLSAQRRAEEAATIALANEKLNDGISKEQAIQDGLLNQNGTIRKTVESYNEAKLVVGATAAQQVEQLAAITASEKEAGKTTEWQKLQIELNKEISKITAENEKRADTAMQKAMSDFAASRVAIMSERTAKETAYDQQVASLQEQVKLAGMSADEAERQSAVFKQIHADGEVIVDDHVQMVSKLVLARQETEKWQQVVQSLTTPLEEFPDGFLEAVGAEIEAELQEITA